MIDGHFLLAAVRLSKGAFPRREGRLDNVVPGAGYPAGVLDVNDISGLVSLLEVTCAQQEM